jgi:dTDP-4-amino-4,6-dideoxygalactose transaminase
MTVFTESRITTHPRPPTYDVPMSDLKAQYETIREDVNRAVLDVMAGGSYVLGPSVERFEDAFGETVGATHCVGVNSGTSALHLAMICAGVGAGDEVITVPLTFIGTAWGISYVGAKPVFVDVDPATCTMDAKQVEQRITSRTRAIVPVHLYGQPADMNPLLEVARRHGIPVIEDAAQAHGATYYGKSAGAIGSCGCFSFYPGKNLGAYGEAGAIVTNDDCADTLFRSLRDHAQRQRFHHDQLGFNYRMDAIQAAVLTVKLKHLAKWNEARRRLAQRYLQLLAGLPLKLPVEAPGRVHAWHLFVVRHPQRTRIRKELLEHGVQTGLHYPIPLHLQEAYAQLGGRNGDFPVAEEIAAECLSLPLFAEMTFEQQDAVVECLQRSLNEAWK